MSKADRDEQWIEEGGHEPGREGAEDREKRPGHVTDKEEASVKAQQAREEAEEAEEAMAEQSRRVGTVVHSVQQVLGEAPELRLDPSLPLATKFALEALYQAKTGEGKTGEYLPGARRNKLFNEALAQLRPVLALGTMPEYKQFEEDFELIREEAAELRWDIRQRIWLEGHRGRVRREQPVDKAEKHVDGVKLSKLGSIAWELARLGRKKRKPFDHDPEEYPIVDALDTMSRYAFVFGTIGARLAVLEARLSKMSDIWIRRRGALKRHVSGNKMSMIRTLHQFLRSCESDSDVPGDIGSHPILREKFAPLVVKFRDANHSDEAIPAALAIVKHINALLDDHKKLMKTSEKPDKPKKKGWFRR